MREWVIRHPYLTGAAFAALVGFGAFNAFRAGLAVGMMRVLDGDAARLASEALGG